MIQLSQAQIERSGISRLTAQHALDQTDQAITLYLFGSCEHWAKPYCFPKYKTIEAGISEWFGIQISDSTLYRRLVRLESLGLIERVCRHKRDKDGSFKPNSTLYKLKGKLAELWHHLQRIGRKLRPLLRLSFLTDNPSLRGRVSERPDTLSPGEKASKDLKGGPAGNISSESPPRRWNEGLPYIRDILKKLGD